MSDLSRKTLLSVSTALNRQLGVNVAVAGLLNALRSGDALSDEDIDNLMSRIADAAAATSDVLSAVIEEYRT